MGNHSGTSFGLLLLASEALSWLSASKSIAPLPFAFSIASALAAAAAAAFSSSVWGAYSWPPMSIFFVSFSGKQSSQSILSGIYVA